MLQGLLHLQCKGDVHALLDWSLARFSEPGMLLAPWQGWYKKMIMRNGSSTADVVLNCLGL